MQFKEYDYVKITIPNGEYRYGYIQKVSEHGFRLDVSLQDEGFSKIEFDTVQKALVGEELMDFKSLLTERERRIVAFIGNCRENSYIASKLSISPTTVRSYIRTLRFKLGLANKTQLDTYCAGLIRKQNGTFSED